MVPADSEDVTPLLEREVRGDERAAALAGLHDDRGGAQPRNDPVARREPPRRGLDPRLVLGDHEPAFRYAPRELRVRGRVVAVDSTAENGTGEPVGVQGAAVRLPVDSARQAAHDHEARAREVAGERTGDRPTVGRARTGSDNGDGRAREVGELAAPSQEELSGRVVNRAKQRRELGVSSPQAPYVRHADGSSAGSR